MTDDGWAWSDHVPSGYEDQTGYGQVSCSCGWDSSGKTGWVEHITAMGAASESGRLAPDWRERVFDAVREANEALGRGTLSAAWREAEAALPDDRGLWLIQGVQLVDTSDSEDLNDEQLEWEAEAVDHRRGGQPTNITALGPTPAAALQALAVRLRERQG